MAEDAGNRGLFCDLAGTLVKMDDTRQLPLGAEGKSLSSYLPGRGRETQDPIRDHLIFVVTNQAGIAGGGLASNRSKLRSASSTANSATS